MWTRRALTLLTLTLPAFMPVGAAGAADDPLVGTWSGDFVFGSVRARLRMEIFADGTARARSLDADAPPRAGAVRRRGDGIEIAYPEVKAVFAGRLVGPDRLEGQWRQAGQVVPIVFTRGEAAAGPAAEAQAQGLSPERLEALRAAAGTPALAGAWRRDGAETRVLASGVRSAGASVRVTPGDAWLLGSLTKSMTATLIARAVEAGVLAWNDTVGRILGEKLGAAASSGPFAQATLLHLLSHRSGLAANLPSKEMRRFSFAALADPREERLDYARRALSLPPEGALGERHVYSNAGYVVAAVMLEQRLDAPWERAMVERLFSPLKLNGAGFGPPGGPDRLDQPLGHYAGPGAKPTTPRTPVVPRPGVIADNAVVLGPAARAHMPLQDLVAYLGAHRDRDPALLTREGWDRLHRPPFGGDYALGWTVRPDGSLWHNGSNTLWYAEALVDPAAGCVAAAAANEDVEGLTRAAVGQALLDSRAAALARP